MDKQEFITALHVIATEEFRDIPNEQEFVHDYSQQFTRKINKLIKNEKQHYWYLINSIPKKIAVIFLVFIIMLSTACSVTAIREPIVRFFVETYEKFTHYFFEGDVSESIQYEYDLDMTSYGFNMIDYQKGDATIIKSYQNDQGDIIDFSQSITDQTELFVDAEKGETITEHVGELTINIYISENCLKAIWIQDSYLMQITYYGNSNTDVILEMIQTLK